MSWQNSMMQLPGKRLHPRYVMHWRENVQLIIAQSRNSSCHSSRHTYLPTYHSFETKLDDDLEQEIMSHSYHVIVAFVCGVNVAYDLPIWAS